MSTAASGTSRRAFLGRAAGAAAVVAGAGVGAGAIAQSAAAADKRTYTAGRFALDLDGASCGKFGGLDGGQRELAVVREAVGTDYYQKKHIGNVKYEDFTMQIGSAMGKPMYDWIKASFDKGSSARKSGAVIACDFNYKEKSARSFSQAFITEVTIPALDAGSKEAGYFAVSMSSDKVAPRPPSGGAVLGQKQKAWLCSNFVFEVGGLDTSRVAKIDSFTWKCSIAPDGSQVLDVSDITVTLPQSSLSSWQEWYKSMASGADDERDGALTVVGADGGTVVTIGLYGLGLFHLSKDTSAPAGERRFNVELYCEKASWDVKKNVKV